MVHDFPEDTDLLAEIKRLERELDTANEERFHALDERDRARERLRRLTDLLREFGQW
jgi:outer membrane murein-binding lipoprotein Lpp